MAGEEITVLFIEDDQDVVPVVREVLDAARNGHVYTVESAPTLAAGLKRLETGGIKLVLLDLHLSDSKGIPTLTKLRDRFPWLPVVVISGIDSIDSAEACVRAGAQDYVVKSQLAQHLRLSWAIRLAIVRSRVASGMDADDFLTKTSDRLDTIERVVNARLGGTPSDLPRLRSYEG